MAEAQEPDRKVRRAQFAGSWYPGGKAELQKTVDDLLAAARPPEWPGPPVAVIAPHAGYRYSAAVAAAGYRSLPGRDCRRVIVVAFSHRLAGSYRGVDAPREVTAYETPLGAVPVDREVCDKLLKKAGFCSNPDIDRGEHSLELQLPFLQRTLRDFRVVPLYVGRMSDEDYVRVAEALLPFIDRQTVIVVSSDGTHFGPDYGYEPFREETPKKLRELAHQAAAPLLKADFDGFAAHLDRTGDTICGRGPILLLLRILSMQGGADGVRAAFDTSGRQTGDERNSVTYQSFVYARRAGRLDEPARRVLLNLARAAVQARLDKRPPPKVNQAALPEAARVRGACFVTLQNHGELRGCIGAMVADGPLAEAVAQNAVSACEDYRFAGRPVTATELEQIDLEISYLTPMQRVKNVEEIIIGRHGLLISMAGRRGVLLPQVAYERGWRRSEFLSQTCHKAGLPADAWTKPEAEIHCFEAEVFGENP